ncbi:MAG: hypothetical protein P8J82_00490 [Tateyamaria sp.]|nr:hypothetical protein [Tateyamaria sp.]
MSRVLSVIALLGLVACGADGEPIKPTSKLDINAGSTGLHVGGSIGVSKGPLSVGLGVF